MFKSIMLALAAARVTEVESLDSVKKAENMLLLLRSSNEEVSADITAQLERAEQQLGNSNVAFSWVDAADHKDIAQHLQVNRVPAIVFKHKNGVVNLPNTALAHDIVREINSVVSPQTSSKMSCQDLVSHQGRYVMFFNGKSSDDYFKVHQALAREFGNEVIFGHSDSASACEF